VTETAFEQKEMKTWKTTSACISAVPFDFLYGLIAKAEGSVIKTKAGKAERVKGQSAGISAQ
jgi:hypothetical protein